MFHENWSTGSEVERWAYNTHANSMVVL